MAPLNGGQGSYGQPARADPMAILNECRDIDRGIDAIERNLERLRSLQQRALDDPDASQGTQTNRELDALNSDTMTLYRNFTDRLRKIKSNPESGNAQNKSQVGRVDRKLKDAINKYQNVDADFRQKLQAQMARQYRIVRPDASDAEVREACEDTTQTQLFSQAVSFFSFMPYFYMLIQLVASPKRSSWPVSICTPSRSRETRGHSKDREAS